MTITPREPNTSTALAAPAGPLAVVGGFGAGSHGHDYGRAAGLAEVGRDRSGHGDAVLAVWSRGLCHGPGNPHLGAAIRVVVGLTARPARPCGAVSVTFDPGSCRYRPAGEDPGEDERTDSFWLALPGDEDATADTIWIAAPAGRSVAGARVGDVVYLETEGRRRWGVVLSVA